MKSVGLVVVNTGWQTPRSVKFPLTTTPEIDRLVSFQMLCHTLDVTVVFINSRHLKHKTIAR
jgi:hypothetical protein